MYHKTEQEIMQNWQGEIKDPVVSICCIAYNHGAYIAQALDSFLMQETSFPFEILIHDDKSTDNTQEIILQYVHRYPKLIKTIFQTENQYSQGKRIMPFLFAISTGDYIALCEGDDYWTDHNKLQYQLDKMQQYPSCHISFHPVHSIRNDILTDEILSRHKKGDELFSPADLILGDGGFCPTASIMVKKEVVINLPDLILRAPVGDYFLQILASVHGGALYIDKVMAAYRQGHHGSWSYQRSSFTKNSSLVMGLTKSLLELDEFLAYKYHNVIMRKISKNCLGLLKDKNYSIQNRRDVYATCKKYFSIKQKLNWFFRYQFR